MKKKEKIFKLHWLDILKSEEIIRGFDISDAFMKAGYDGGAINALDYFEEVNPETMEVKGCKQNENGICALGAKLPCAGQPCAVKII